MATPTGLTVTASELTGSAPFEASITATATDPDLGVVTIDVQWDADTLSSGEAGDTLTHTFDTPGVYPVAVTAYDDNNHAAATAVVVIVNPPDGLDRIDSDTGLCGDPWFTAEDLACNTSEYPELAEMAVTAAIRFMVDATCRNYVGICSAIVRPPESISGCKATGNQGRFDISLGVPAPIRRIVAVYVDGELVDPSYYRLVNHKWIVAHTYTDEDDDNPLVVWPQQRMDRPLGDVDTWHIEVEYGRPVPEPLRLAAMQMACEIYSGLTGGECGFPDGASSISQQGVTVSFQARTEGKTGIPKIDMQIERYGCSSTKSSRRLHDPAAHKPEVAQF